MEQDGGASFVLLLWEYDSSHHNNIIVPPCTSILNHADERTKKAWIVHLKRMDDEDTTPNFDIAVRHSVIRHYDDVIVGRLCFTTGVMPSCRLPHRGIRCWA